MIKLTQCSLHGQPVGTDHWRVRHSDDLVAQVQAMRAAGMPYKQIEAATGVVRQTAWSWVVGLRRKPAVRIIARRVKDRQKRSANPQASPVRTAALSENVGADVGDLA